MNANQFRWPVWRVAELKRRVENKESATEIAKALGPGFTRNAVIGKAHRAGMRLDSHGRAHLRESLPVKVTAQRIKTPPEPVAFTPRTTPLVSIMELKNGVCRFPIGDPRDDNFGYCGAKMPEDLSGPYCCEHRLIAYTGKAFPSSGRPFKLSPIGLPRIVYEVAE